MFPELGADGQPAGARGAHEFRELAANAPVMIWRASADMLCDFCNPPLLAFTGRTMEQESGMGWAEGIHPEDYDRCVETYVTAFRTRQPFRMDFRLRRHDGVYRWVLSTAAPFERDGAFAGYFGSCIDIDDRKQLEEAQRRTVEELNHRVKNVLASVQAIAYQTFRGGAEPKAAYSTFLGRLQAMAGAHDLVASKQGAGCELVEVVRRAAHPHLEEGERFRLRGDPVRIGPKRTLSLTLCLHELATNALRHGALRAESGRVEVDWTVQQDRIHLVWNELAGPPAPRRESTGFGLRLVETLGREGGAEVRLCFPPEGLTCAISFPPTVPERRSDDLPPGR